MTYFMGLIYNNLFRPMILILVLIFLVSMNGCGATIKIPAYEVHSSSRNTLRETSGDLTIAVEAFTNAETVKHYFGTNLLSRGILPILIIANNNSTSESYLLLEHNVSLVEAGNNDSTLPAAQSVHLPSQGNAMLVTAAVLASPALYMIGSKMISDESAIKYNMIKKQMRNNTLSPGEGQHGFVYFKLERQYAASMCYRLVIPVVDILTTKPIYFRFQLRKGAGL